MGILPMRCSINPRPGMPCHESHLRPPGFRPPMLALIGHDQKKAALVEFVLRHRDVFERHQLVATGSTGRLIAEKVGLNVECLAPGPDGGDLIIGLASRWNACMLSSFVAIR